MSDTPMSPMYGSPKRVARSADPPIANALKPVLAMRRAERASCASGVTSGRSTFMTLAIDGRCKISPRFGPGSELYDMPSQYFLRRDQTRHSNNTKNARARLCSLPDIPQGLRGAY